MVACNKDELGSIRPVLQVCRSVDDRTCDNPMDLGILPVGRDIPLQLVFRNTGSGVLHIKSVELLEGEGEILSFSEYVGIERFKYLRLSFTPKLGEQHIKLRIESNDFVEPIKELVLIYSGVDGLLEVCPVGNVFTIPDNCSPKLEAYLDDVRVADEADVTFLVRNIGVAPLWIEDAVIEDLSSQIDEFRFLSSTEGGFILPQEELYLTVRYAPEDEIPDALKLEIFEEGLTSPSATLTVYGSEKGNQPPVAEIQFLDVDAELTDIHVGHRIWLDGSGSLDPEGDPLRYRWSILQGPPTTVVGLGHPQSVATAFSPDVVGNYVVELVVRDSLGLEGKKQFEFDVKPFYELTFEVRWEVGQADLDLHVVPTGESLFGPTDCFFKQPLVNWGDPSLSADDPNLILDDQGESSVERIVIESPSSGAYDVFVHYFESSESAQGQSAQVHVIENDGERQLQELTGFLGGVCDVWPVGTVFWPQGTFVPSSLDNWGQCYGEGDL